MKNWMKIVGGIILAFILMQLVPVDKVNPAVKANEDFVKIHNTPQNVYAVMKKACYDCHSNETVYPSYSKFAPISWSVKNHVNQGRTYMNWSIWGTYNNDLKKGMIEKTINSIDKKTMPINGYLVYHPEAKLSDAERTLLINYFKSIAETKTY